MKKILAIALALVLVCSMGMVALAEDPVQGTAENPVSVYSVAEVNYTWVEVAAGTTVWYNFDSMSFDGKTLQASMGTLTKITVDGTEYYPSPALRGGIEAKLEASAPSMLVGFVNESEYDTMVMLEIAVPQGVESNPQTIYEGDNILEPTIEVLNETVGMYYTALNVEWGGGFDFTATSLLEGADDGFEIVVRYYDVNEVAAEESFKADADGVISGSVVPAKGTSAQVIVVCTGWDIPVVELNVQGPEEGSEDRPLEIWWSGDLENLIVPANSTLYVSLVDFLYACSELCIDSTVEAFVGEDMITYMELGEEAPYEVTLKLVNSSEEDAYAPIWVEYPAGTMQNPEWVEDGNVDLYYDGYTYYYVYYALNDGTVTVKLDNIDTIVGLSAENTTVTGAEDYDYAEYDKYFDYMNKHADKDENGEIIYDDETGMPVFSDPSQYYVSVTVNKGDEVIISFEGGKWDDEGNLIPMEAVVTVEGPEAPLGTFDNPDTFEAGKNEFTVSAEDMMYAGTWTAPADGTITITVTGEVTDFLMGHIETDDPLIMSEGDKLVLDVKKGDEIAFVAVAGLDDAGNPVDTAVEMNIDFVEAKTDSPATGAAGAGVAVLLTLISGAGLAVLNKKRG